MTFELTAYQLMPDHGYTIEPAEARRDWMDKTVDKAANRCLPLTMANQVGWIIRCPTRFKVTWDHNKPGGNALTITFSEHPDRFCNQIVSKFGSGILSFVIPWIFRTPEGYGLMVRGPTNSFKPNVAPLDGLVETDWAPYTFTMNWKMLAHLTPVWFEKGEPICMIIPYPLDLGAQVRPRVASLESNPKLKEDFHLFSMSRIEQMKQNRSSNSPTMFRLDYMRGRMPDGKPAPEHRTNLKLQPFTDERAREGFSTENAERESG